MGFHLHAFTIFDPLTLYFTILCIITYGKFAFISEKRMHFQLQVSIEQDKFMEMIGWRMAITSGGGQRLKGNVTRSTML